MCMDSGEVMGKHHNMLFSRKADLFDMKNISRKLNHTNYT